MLTTSFILCCTLAVAADPAATAVEVPRWGRFEAALTARAETSPDTELLVEFMPPAGRPRTVRGFWDGGSTWRVRFMPDEEGTWRFRTRSDRDTGLDGRSGSFVCRQGKDDPNPWLRHGSVRVSSNGRHLQYADGLPFFWLADTVWNGPALSSAKDWSTYLDDRLAKRFSAIQFNSVCPWRTAPTDAEGQTALTGTKKIRINPDYFRRLDARIDEINARGQLAVPVLLWANSPTDLGNTLPEKEIIRLLQYQVARYGANHVVWILAGDNSYNEASAAKWKKIGHAVFGGNAHPAPVTTHPTGMNWPWGDWRDETWLSVLGYQSGHGDSEGTLKWIHSGPPSEHWKRAPYRPIINLEPPYEDHKAYQSRMPHSAYSVRRAVYWSLLSTPTAGVTYGAHGLWSWQTKAGEEPLNHKGTGVARTWQEALALPGSTDMKHMAELFQSVSWWRLRPYPQLLETQPGGKDPARFVAAAWSDEEDLALIYLPVGGEVQVKVDRLVPGLEAEWMNPRTGRRIPARGEGGKFKALDEQDWVLLFRRK